MPANSPSQSEVDPTPITSAARPYLRRLERLFTALFRMQVDGPNGLFRLQLDLLELQRDIQKEIRLAKAGPKSPDKTAVLAGLRAALWDARRFGDAFAWLLLHSERHVIYPLADNPQRVAVPPKDDAWVGFEAVVAHLGGKGLGFPLLHDITDTLRIGDVTFIVPGEPHATAEIKTHITSSEPTEKGRKMSYEITAIWGLEEPPVRVRNVGKGTATLPDKQARAKRQRPAKPSIGRQLRRLRKAEQLRAAGDGEFIQHEEGDPSLTIFGPGSKGKSHWTVLRRLARAARRDGCVTRPPTASPYGWSASRAISASA